MSSTSTKMVLGKLDGRSTSTDVARHLGTQTLRSYSSVRIYIPALDPTSGIALSCNTPIPTAKAFRLAMIPKQIMAEGTSCWRASLERILDNWLKDPDVFNDQFIEIKDRNLMRTFDGHFGGQRVTCAVLTCEISGATPSSIISFFQVDTAFSTSDSMVYILNRKDLIDILK